MKKIMVFLAMLAALMMVSAAWARERSCLLSKRELATIEQAARKAYAASAQIEMVVDEDLFGRYTIIEFIKVRDDKLSLRLEVNAFGAIISDAESKKVCEVVGDKVVEAIEKILNERPRAALEVLIK